MMFDMINLLLLLTVIFWGLSFVATKMALNYLTPFEIIAIRLFLGIPVLILVLFIKKIKLSFQKSDVAVLLGGSLILGLHVLIQAYGLIYTTATNSGWLIATVPVAIVILSRIFLMEKVKIRQIIGVGAATLGVILLVSKGKLNSLGWLESIGDWLILSSVVTWAVYTIITRNITQRRNPLAVSLILLIPPAVVTNIYVASSSPISKLLNLPFHMILVMFFLGAVCLGFGNWFWMEGLSHKGAIRTGIFLYFEPLVTTAAAIPILGEKISVFMIIGAALIIGGVYLVERRTAAES
jgi:drug/metabolite transporter (DMT)-like permease